MPETHDHELEALVRRLATGDRTALEKLIAHTHEQLRRLARRQLRGSFSRLGALEETDDVVQNLYLRLLKGWEKLMVQEPGAAKAGASEFLCRVSRLLREVMLDLARQHYGRRGNRPGKVALDAENTTGHPRQNVPGTETYNPDALSRFTEFHAAVQALPDNLRQVVDLHGYQGLPHAEVGHLMGIAEPTVRKYWTQAREQLTAKLGGRPGEWFQ